MFYEGDKVQDSIRFASDCPFCFSCSTGPVIKTNLSVIAEAQSIHINQDGLTHLMQELELLMKHRITA